MKATVIVCTYSLDRVEDTIEAIQSVLSQDEKGIEIIVIPDDRVDLVRTLSARFPQEVKIEICSKPGLSFARNKGVSLAQGDIIIFLDDDAIAEKGWLSTLLGAFADPKIGVAGGKIDPEWVGGRPFWFPPELDWVVGCTYTGHPEKTCEIRNVIGCNMAFRREVFETVGFFKTDIGRVGKKLLAGEEMELCVRIAHEMPETSIVYVPTAKVYHKVPPERKKIAYLLSRCYMEGVSKRTISKKHRYLGEEKERVALSSEREYIYFLFSDSIPTRLNNIISGRLIITSLSQLFILLLGLLVVGIGFLFGNVLKKGVK